MPDPIDNIRQKRADKASQDAESARTQSIIDAVKQSGGETTDALSSSMRDLLMATIIGKDPKLAEVAGNLAELLESISEASDNFKSSGLEVVPETFGALVEALKSIPRQVADTDKSPELIPYLEQINKTIQSKNLTPNINIPDLTVDLSPIADLTKRLEKAIKDNKVDIKPSDTAQLEGAVGRVEDAIKSLKFPIANYILPFKDVNGKAVQVQLDGSGNVPVTSGGGGGGTQYSETTTTSPATGNAVLGRYNSSQPTYTNGQMGMPQIDANGNLKVNIVAGAGSGGTSSTDDAAFTAGSGLGTPMMGFATSDTVDSGDVGVVAMDVNRNLKIIAQANSGVDIGDVTVNNASGASAVNIQDGGNSITVDQATGSNLHVVVDSGSITTGGLTDTQLRATPVPVSGTVTATAQTDIAPSTINVTTLDSGSTSTVSANGQALVTGSPTANSTASFSVASLETIRVQVTGTWTGTLSSEASIDGGTTWVALGVHQGAYTAGSFTQNFVGGANLAGATNYRIRATAAMSGTATVKVIESINTASVYIANAAPAGNVVSLLNSTTATLLAAGTFTGTGEDVANFSEMRISLIASHASATNGLSIQQSTDNSNWDITDTYTIPATTGKTFVVPRQARYFRIVYTNGGTNQTSFRLQVILNRTATAGSSQRAQDAYSIENDLEQVWSFNSLYNGTSFDLMRGDTTNGLDVDVTRLPALVAGSATVGSIASITTSVVPGTAATNLGKAEDGGHTTGDTGVFALGVRNDNAATDITSANADYSQLSTDIKGAVFNRPAPSTSPTLANVAAATSSTTLIASNAARRLAVIYNDSTSDCYIKFGSTASSTSFTVYLPSLGTFTVNGEDYSGIITGIWISATGNARCTEVVA